MIEEHVREPFMPSIVSVKISMMNIKIMQKVMT